MLLFVSDLHLGEDTPALNRLFLHFLEGRARAAEALYILGDLFEVWIGDDDLETPAHRRVADGLRDLTDRGVAVYVMHGNRDFLLGSGFAAHTGARLIDEPHIVSTASWQFVLAHGDALCLADTAYQAFRAQVRAPAWQQGFLSRPLDERRAFAREARARSMAGQAAQSSLSDLDPGATEDFLRAHGYATFIHGHTHRPATHDHIVDGIHVERWVLSDWHDDRGECLVWDEAAHRLMREPILPARG